MVLYDGKHKVSEQEVLEKVRYFYNRANQGMEYWSQGDKRVALDLAKDLRNALRDEYKNIDLKRIEQAYEDDNNFINFRAAVRDAYTSVTGQTTNQNAHSFLYDVSYYMRYYFSKMV